MLVGITASLPLVDLEKFTFSPFEATEVIDYVKNVSTQQDISPLANEIKVEGSPLPDSDVRMDFHLLEYILLNIDFDYNKKVPSVRRLTFRMPELNISPK